MKFTLDSFRPCLESEKYYEEIKRQAGTANGNGIHGTPAFVVGKSTRDGVEGELVVGAVPFGILDQKLKQFSK